MHWAIWDAMFKAQGAIEGVISNFPGRFIAGVMRVLVFPLGRPYVVPSDRAGHEVARLLIEPSATRDRLTTGIYQAKDEHDILAAIELALGAAIVAEPVEARVRDAARAGRLAAASGADRYDTALAAGVITADERAQLERASRLADEVIAVDDFASDLGLSDARSSSTEVETKVVADAIARSASRAAA